MKRKKVMLSDDFIKLLLEETPKFDEEILKDIRLEDDWSGVIMIGEGDHLYNSWCETIDSVRSLSEGLAFKAGTRYERDTKIFPLGGMPMGTTDDRFQSIWPDTTKDWKKSWT